MVGSLQYLQLSTRPDLVYTVGKLARFVSNPSKAHIDAALDVLSYLNSHCDYRIVFTSDKESNDIQPEAYIDVDWAGDKSDRKSMAGYIFMLASSTFSWLSKKESTVNTSTMEAEYIALFLSTQQAAWMWQFYEKIGFPLKEPITVHTDSQAAISVAKGEFPHKRSKHLDIKLHAVRECIQNSQIEVCYVPTKSNPADIFTKSLPKSLFSDHLDGLGIKSTDDNEPGASSSIPAGYGKVQKTKKREEVLE